MEIANKGGYKRSLRQRCAHSGRFKSYFCWSCKMHCKIERDESLTKDIFWGKGRVGIFQCFQYNTICVAKPE